jgi:hypothetical protein
MLSEMSVVAAETVEKECSGFGGGPKGRSQLPLEFNRRSGRIHSTRIGLEE